MNSLSSLKVIKYWRNSLADMDNFGLSTSRIKNGKKFNYHEFKTNCLSVDELIHFFLDAEKKLAKKSLLDKKKIAKLPVMIVPLTVVRKYSHMKMVHEKISRYKEFFPLWLIADLYRDGRMAPSKELIFPRLDRKYLTPNEAQFSAVGGPILGELKKVDEFYENHQQQLEKSNGNWHLYFQLAEKLLETVTENRFEGSLERQNFSLIQTGFILPLDSILEPNRFILNAYDQLIESNDGKSSQLLCQFASLEKKTNRTGEPLKRLFELSKAHYAQIQNLHPLSFTQRKSMSYVNLDDNNDILTIHGPPGTGKTDFILNAVASKWVEAAIFKNPPPIIVISSTNNQAVLNIFFALKEKITPSTHWLPKLNTPLLYLASSSNKEDFNKIDCLFRFKEKETGSIGCFYTKDYLEKAEEYFINCFNLFFKKNKKSLTHCQLFLHKQLLKKKKQLHEAIDFSSELHAFNEKFFSNYDNILSLEDLLKSTKKEKDELQLNLEKLRRTKANWLQYKLSNLKWLRIVSWLPFIKSIIKDKIEYFVLHHQSLFSTSFEGILSIENFFNQKIDSYEKKVDQKADEIKKLILDRTSYSEVEKIKISFEKKIKCKMKKGNLFDFNQSSNLLNRLDVTIRHDLFRLATNYWQVTWLIESKKQKKHPLHFKGRECFWQRQAMLTPYLVTTLQTGPSFFQYLSQAQEFETLTNFLDLLIIDEAGQALPAVAGGMISIAKKALLVGDDKQIEPIVNIPNGIDFANAKKFDLCQFAEEYEHLKKVGVLCSSDVRTGKAFSNVISRGQLVNPYQMENEKSAGIMLKEHRRCAKEIIQYCNELCYHNELIPMTQEDYSCFPRMGYAHIKGHVEKVHGSLKNTFEAQEIADWISRNQSKILTMCEKDNLSDCVAILTPFRLQKQAIHEELINHKLDIAKFGTVHSLQGSEKPIIIFSPVYNASDQAVQFFFDKLPNMLNVAVSRAKRSFLVFGDMDIFDAHSIKNPHSALLASYLFKNPENEIKDVIQPKFLNIQRIHGDHEIQQINSLSDHRHVLHKAFLKTEHELTIVSPFIRLNAIHADDILNTIRLHAARISIYIFSNSNVRFNSSDTQYEKLIQLLKNAGAICYEVENIHSKLIAIDNKIIVEGSFNWLSAARQGSFINDESSIIYSGAHVENFIREALFPIKRKAKLVGDVIA